mgnify:CR=1 FL=1
MIDYLNGVMERLSIGGLITFLILILIGLAFTRKKKPTKASHETSIKCPMCGKGGES